LAQNKSLQTVERLPEPDLSARVIADDLWVAMGQFAAVAADLWDRLDRPAYRHPGAAGKEQPVQGWDTR
jgi:hypothetical protein